VEQRPEHSPPTDVAVWLGRDDSWERVKRIERASNGFGTAV
jgi:hypothetical protein